MKQLICPYCRSKASLVDAYAVYAKSGFGKVYACDAYPQCDSYVGVHKQSDTPLGSLANPELRALRKQCYAVFDPLWHDEGFARHEVYRVLTEAMSLRRQVHIAEFREADAKKMLALADSPLKVREKLRRMLGHTHTQDPLVLGDFAVKHADFVAAVKYHFVAGRAKPATWIKAASVKGSAAFFKRAVELGLCVVESAATGKAYVLTPKAKALVFV